MMIVSLRGIRRVFSNAMIFGLTLLVVFLVWARSASMISIFLPMENEPALVDLWPYLLVSTMVGGVSVLIGYATWHGYLETIDASAWPDWQRPGREVAGSAGRARWAVTSLVGSGDWFDSRG